MIDFKLYLISDRHLCQGRSLEEELEQACGAGVKAVQIREKDLNGDELLRLTQRIKTSLSKYKVKIFINQRSDIALMTGLPGVHLPSTQLGLAREVKNEFDVSFIVGASAHSVNEVKKAEQEGADFIVLGPIFETPSKILYGRPLGVEVLEAASRVCKIPVFAIGGIRPRRVRECLDSGAHGVAVISSILSVKDIGGAVRDFEKQLGGL